MTTLLTLLILIGLALYGLQEYYQIKLGIRPRQTPQPVIDEIARILQSMGETGGFIDLGSGYGSTVFGLAKVLPGWEIIGIEKSPTPWLIANFRSFGKNYGNYNFFIADATTIPLKAYDVVFADQNISIMKGWEGSLARRLQPGMILLTLNAPLPRIKPVDKITIDDVHTLYVYRKAYPNEQPLPVEIQETVVSADAATETTPQP
jgi:hypothetical protein